MGSPSFLFLLVTAVAATVEEASNDFHPRGMQQFKPKTTTPFNDIHAQDCTVPSPSAFTLEGVQATYTDFLVGTDIFGFVYVGSRQPRVRVTFRTSSSPVSSLHYSLTATYRDEQNRTAHRIVPASNQTESLICPRADRGEFGRCSYGRDYLTFEDIVLPREGWPRVGKDAHMLVSMRFFNGTQEPKSVLCALFIAHYQPSI